MGKQVKGEKVRRSKVNPRITACPKCHLSYTTWDLKGDRSCCRKCGKVIGQPDESLIDPTWQKGWITSGWARQHTSKAYKRLRENRGN